jgi:hypothetical protein
MPECHPPSTLLIAQRRNLLGADVWIEDGRMGSGDQELEGQLQA